MEIKTAKNVRSSSNRPSLRRANKMFVGLESPLFPSKYKSLKNGLEYNPQFTKKIRANKLRKSQNKPIKITKGILKSNASPINNDV